MFHNRSLSNNLSDWEETLLNDEDSVETILEPTNIFDDHVDTMVQGEIIADARFISEGESKTSHSIEAGRDHSYNAYTAQSYLEMPSTHLYHHQKSNISPRQHTNPRPSVLEPNLVVDSSDNSKSKPYVDHKYKDFNEVNERLVNWPSCIVGEKLHAIQRYGGTLEEDCLANLYSGKSFNENFYLGNNNWNGRSEGGYRNEQYRYDDNVASFNGESSVNSSKIGEGSKHRFHTNISHNITSYRSVQPENKISRPSVHDASLVVKSRDISKLQPYVDHTYIDFSKVDDRLVTESSRIIGEKLHAIFRYGGALSNDHHFVLGDTASKGTTQRLKKRRRDTFPSRLMTLLSDDPDPSIISWLPHGRSFTIKHQKRFMDEIHHRYFKPSKFKSFQRMLNMWGMKRITAGKDIDSYYSQFFLRGKPNLVSKMTLAKRKNGFRPLPNPDEEPDFYRLARFRPLSS